MAEVTERRYSDASTPSVLQGRGHATRRETPQPQHLEEGHTQTDTLTHTLGPAGDGASASQAQTQRNRTPGGAPTCRDTCPGPAQAQHRYHRQPALSTLSPKGGPHHIGADFLAVLRKK